MFSSMQHESSYFVHAPGNWWTVAPVSCARVGQMMLWQATVKRPAHKCVIPAGIERSDSVCSSFASNLNDLSHNTFTHQSTLITALFPCPDVLLIEVSHQKRSPCTFHQETSTFLCFLGWTRKGLPVSLIKGPS